jgi:OmpA-OmpF porin, OOP family
MSYRVSQRVCLRAALPPNHSAQLGPAAIGLWSLGAFVFLCALCLYNHLHRTYDARVHAHQARLWHDAPALAMHITYGSVRLSGAVATRLGHERLLQRTREVFGAQAVVDQVRVERSAVPEDWLDTAVSLIWLAGKKIDNGTIELRGDRVRVSGSVTDMATKNALIDNLQAVLSEHAVLQAQLSLTPKHAPLSAALARLLASSALQFPARSAVLTPEAKRSLDQVAPLLRKSTARIDIIGYADPVGAPELSQRLSALRADAVRAYLVERGVAPQQLRALGAGATRAREDGRSNRRAEMRVVDAQ